MSTDTLPASSALRDSQQNWRLLLAVGVLISLLGLLAVLAPFVTGIGLSLLLGGLLVVGALGHAVRALRSRGEWRSALWQTALAFLYGIAGLSLLFNPVLGLASLTILLIAYLAVEGLVEVVGGLAMRSEPHWGWVVASGVVSLVLAGLLWAGFPSTALWAVGLLVGLHLLSTGLMLVVLGYYGRRGAVTGTSETMGGEPRST